MEINVILKYRRPKDCWLCPECDSENDTATNRCFVCNCARPIGIELLRKWTPADDRENPPGGDFRDRKHSGGGVKIPPRPRVDRGRDEPIFRDHDAPPPPQSSSAVGVIWGIIIAIIILTILFMAVASGRLQATLCPLDQTPIPIERYAAYSASLPEPTLPESSKRNTVPTADEETISERQANQT